MKQGSKYLVTVMVLIILLNACRESNSKETVLEKLQYLDSLDVKMGAIQSGDWLEGHPEKGQTLAQYQKTKFVSPTTEKNKIYIQPIGDFSEAEYKVVTLSAAYIQDFFQIQTVLLKPIHDSIIPDEHKRFLEGHHQIQTGFILDSILIKNLAPDAALTISITNKDLYPSDDWNFVFGLAYPSKRVSVSSMFQYIDYREPLDNSNYKACLDKMIKTTAHEIGHVFSFKHCVHASCLMNGSNGIDESMRRPNHLCSSCTKKLYWNLGFDLLERNRKLSAFFQAQGNKSEVEYYRKERIILGE